MGEKNEISSTILFLLDECLLDNYIPAGQREGDTLLHSEGYLLDNSSVKEKRVLFFFLLLPRFEGCLLACLLFFPVP